MKIPVRTLPPSHGPRSSRSVREGLRGGIDGEGHGHSHRRRPSLVMIIDDQSTGRLILERLIVTLGDDLQVETFADPAVALDRAAHLTPDLVLTDYKMPTMDGVEFTRRLRRIPGCRDVPLMVVTVVEDRRIRYEALDAGATDFLTRPIDYLECRARCRNLLTMRQQQKVIKDRAHWLEQQVAVATEQIRTREQETLLRLAKAGEYRDEGTGNHVLRMARYSRLIAEELGLTAAQCQEIELAAPMHDIGKIGIPDHILLKKGRLDSDEFGVMQAHARIGYEILKDSPSTYLQQGAVIALGHHERFDGRGYPQGLKGEIIPLLARIVAVADVYDALTTVRPYKGAWPWGEAVNFIREQAGYHFDPKCVQAFLTRLDAILEVQQSLSDGGID